MSETEREAGAETVETTAESTRTVETTATSRQETAQGGGDELAKVRELVLQAHPDVVPDLVRGDSIDELMASVEPARSAYERIAERVRASEGATVPAAPGATGDAEGQTTVVVQPPAVPAGGAANVVDQAALSPQTKIARALEERRRK